MGFTGLAPYLSVVAATRNDNHGGDLTKRTQVFIDGLAAQATRHRVPIELVMVEWNPPPDRPSLAEEMRWPRSTPFYRARIITVPANVHATIDPEFRLPLYQMIGKNVGIRRARAPFILATNIDLLFSDALFRELKRGLKPDRLYRADRYDIDASIPADASIDDALALAQGHIIRIHKANGSYINRNGTFVNTARHPYLHALICTKEGLRDLKQIVSQRVEASGLCHGRTAHLVALGALPVAVFTRILRHTHARIGGRRVGYSPIDGVIKYRLNEIRQSLRIWRKYFRLHTNGCGDFTLLSRDNWFRFSGYAEWVMYSWHIDSVFLLQVDTSRIATHIFSTKACTYHIEHGGGWTPDQGGTTLFDRLRSRGVPYITDDDFYKIEAELDLLRKRRTVKMFNGDNWGLANADLPEVTIDR